MDVERFGDDTVDGHPGVKRAEGVLEDNLDFLTIGEKITARQCGQIEALVVDGACGDGHEACDGASGSSLTAAALTDEADSLTSVHVKTDTIYGFDHVDSALEDTAFDGEVNFEIANGEQSFG